MKARVKAASVVVVGVVAAVVTRQAKARLPLEVLKAKPESPLKALVRMKVKAMMRPAQRGKPRLKLKLAAVVVVDAGWSPQT